MANNPKREGQGTFAQLYDVQEQLSRRNVKPLGRPPKKVQRKPTTVHLTKTETRNLNKLQILVSEQFTINRSELVGVAIDVLTFLMEEKGKNIAVSSEINDVEAFRQYLYNFIKS